MKRRPRPKGASPELLNCLHDLGEDLIRAEASSKFCVKVFWARPNHLQELGVILQSIAQGEDARALFRQNERTKPSKENPHFFLALAYWSVRALDPKAPDRAAINAARATSPEVHNLAAATVRKIAQRRRFYCIGLLALPMEPIQKGRWKWTAKGLRWHHEYTIEPRTPEQISALREYLRKKSARE